MNMHDELNILEKIKKDNEFTIALNGMELKEGKSFSRKVSKGNPVMVYMFTATALNLTSPVKVTTTIMDNSKIQAEPTEIQFLAGTTNNQITLKPWQKLQARRGGLTEFYIFGSSTITMTLDRELTGSEKIDLTLWGRRAKRKGILKESN